MLFGFLYGDIDCKEREIEGQRSKFCNKLKKERLTEKEERKKRKGIGEGGRDTKTLLSSRK